MSSGQIHETLREWIERSAIPIVGLYTASSVFTFFDNLKVVASLRTMTGLEALVQVVSVAIQAIPATIGGIGFILFYKWRHEAAMQRIANDHEIRLKATDNDAVTTSEMRNTKEIDEYLNTLPSGGGIQKIEIPGKPVKAARHDDDTQDFR